MEAAPVDRTTPVDDICCTPRRPWEKLVAGAIEPLAPLPLNTPQEIKKANAHRVQAIPLLARGLTTLPVPPVKHGTQLGMLRTEWLRWLSAAAPPRVLASHGLRKLQNHVTTSLVFASSIICRFRQQALFDLATAPATEADFMSLLSARMTLACHAHADLSTSGKETLQPWTKIDASRRQVRPACTQHSTSTRLDLFAQTSFAPASALDSN